MGWPKKHGLAWDKGGLVAAVSSSGSIPNMAAPTRRVYGYISLPRGMGAPHAEWRKSG
jgi:hypothetical protein